MKIIKKHPLHKATTLHNFVYFILAISLLAGCKGGGGESTPGVDNTACTGPTSVTRTVSVSWQNNDTATNESGGGFRVYAGTTANFDINGATPVDVPSNGTTTPRSVMLTLPSGRHYIKIVAYSAYGGTSNTSLPSTEVNVCVPFST